MRARVTVFVLVLALVACVLPLKNACAETNASTTFSVSVSAEGEAASADDAPFSVDSFKRAQKGSNRELDGAYLGYSYYQGSTDDYVVAVVSESYVLVYIPPAADSLCSLEDEESLELLKSYFVALDEVSHAGGIYISSDAEWLFTTEDEASAGGILYRFAVEVVEGEYYVCAIGEDGSDITSSDAEGLSRPTHVEFLKVRESHEVEIVEASTGFTAFVEFLQGVDFSPLWVTLKTTGTAILFIFVLGLAAAYFTLRINKRLQDIFDTIFTIPMVLPPTVCGFVLLLLLGRNTALGTWFIEHNISLVFSWRATVIAAVVVAFPLMYRSARGAFEGLDPNMLDAARTLGWSNIKIFFKIMMPLSWSSIAAGTVLAFARALGEFGATLFLAGNYAGKTRTIPIAIYFEWMSGNTDVAIFWTVVIMIFSFIVILFINLWSRRTTRYRRGR